MNDSFNFRYGPHSRRRAPGFSLVELMVGMAIGLLGIIMMMQIFALSEGQKRSTTSGADAQSNGAIALYTIERDMRMAGYGMSYATALGCKINASYNGGALTFTLAPVTITNGGVNGEPDSIEVMASANGGWNVPYRLTDVHPPESAVIPLDTTLGMDEGDLLVAFEPGKDCTMMQATLIDNGTIKVHHGSNQNPWNPPGGQNIFPKPDGYKPPAVLFNLGNMLNRIYSISNGASLQLTSFSTAAGAWSAQETLLPQIVNMQAEYGKDTNDDNVVDTYNTVAPVTNADWNQIRAVRMVVVARSGLREKEIVTLAEDAPNTNYPQWAGGNVNVKINPDGSNNADWQFYRYKTFETVIPLRNMIWKAS